MMHGATTRPVSERVPRALDDERRGGIVISRDPLPVGPKLHQHQKLPIAAQRRQLQVWARNSSRYLRSLRRTTARRDARCNRNVQPSSSRQSKRRLKMGERKNHTRQRSDTAGRYLVADRLLLWLGRRTFTHTRMHATTTTKARRVADSPSVPTHHASPGPTSPCTSHQVPPDTHTPASAGSRCRADSVIREGNQGHVPSPLLPSTRLARLSHPSSSMTHITSPKPLLHSHLRRG